MWPLTLGEHDPQTSASPLPPARNLRKLPSPHAGPVSGRVSATAQVGGSSVIANRQQSRAPVFKSLYARPEWLAFRREMLELDGYRCRECKRAAGTGVVLQVHHLLYVHGRMPWEYAYEECETLCRRCHAVKHQKVMPFSGWEYVDDEDLEDLCGECEYCGTDLRYVYYIQHPNWFPLAVGTDCCDFLTSSELAPNGRESMTRFASRRQRFATSERWQDCGGRLLIKQRGMQITVEPINNQFRLRFEEFTGRMEFPTPLDAKRHAFLVVDNRSVQEFLKRSRPSTR